MSKRRRRSAGAKEDVVLRLLRGEDLEAVSRETGYHLHELKDWLDRFRLGGREYLKSRPRAAAEADLEQAKQLIAKQAMALEILGKAKALAESRKP